MRELKVLLLGPFAVQETGRSGAAGTPRPPLLRKAQDLLTMMLIAPERSVLREAAAEALWPETPSETSKKAMRQALWQVHHATDDGIDGPRRLVLSDGDALRINPERRLWVDVAVFVEAVRTAQGAGPRALVAAELERCARAADLYRGPLHAGCYDEWCLIPRARLEDRCLTLLDILSSEHEARGDVDGAITWTQRLLEIEPAHERSHRRLMRLYYRTGDRTRALRQLHQCRWVLEHELGVRPDARTEALGAAISADRLPLDPLLDDVVPHPTGAPEANLRSHVADATDDVASSIEPAALSGLRGELTALRRSIDAIGEQLRSSTA